jgi:squalene cyclase
VKIYTTYFLVVWVIICSFNTIYAQVDNRSLTTSISKARKFLEKHQYENGTFQDSTKVLFNVWETILVCDALLDDPYKNDSIIQNGLNWLKTVENPQGIICHNATCSSSYCIETSSLYLQLLHRVNHEADFAKQLATIAQMQEKNGRWAIGNPDVLYEVYYPSVTGFAVNLFETFDYRNYEKRTALNYIAEQQLRVGSWGQTWEYYDSPGYALWQCFPALKNDSIYSEQLTKAKYFILSTQLENGSWNFSSDEVSNRISPELHTAFMLQVLGNETDEESRSAVERGLRFLLARQQQNGCWDGGLFPIPNQRYRKNEYLIATALIYKAMLMYQHQMNNE